MHSNPEPSEVRSTDRTPSLRFPCRRLLPPRRGSRLAPLVAVTLLAACSSSRAPLDLGVSRDFEPYLISPLEDYPAEVRPEWARVLEEAFVALVEGSEASRAAAVAGSFLREDPSFTPALVLSVQVDFLAERYDVVMARLQAPMEELPGYSPGLLLLARAAELQGDPVTAYQAYQGLPYEVGRNAPRSPRLREMALQVVRLHLEDALARSQLEEAEAQLRLLEQWGPEKIATLESRRQVAAARGDVEVELVAVRELVERGEDTRPTLERLAALEVEVGELREGLRLFQELAHRFPDDPQLAERLAVANFRWRLRLLPQEVQELAGESELTRGQFAKLLFWLIPGIRYGQVTQARIATDILEDSHREEIARVVNLGLMDVDERLHRFEPHRPLRRREALISLLRLPGRFDVEVGCLGGEAAAAESRLVCRTAVECGFLPDEADCLPQDPVVGPQAHEWIRLTLNLLEEK